MNNNSVEAISETFFVATLILAFSPCFSVASLCLLQQQ